MKPLVIGSWFASERGLDELKASLMASLMASLKGPWADNGELADSAGRGGVSVEVDRSQNRRFVVRTCGTKIGTRVFTFSPNTVALF